MRITSIGREDASMCGFLAPALIWGRFLLSTRLLVPRMCFTWRFRSRYLLFLRSLRPAAFLVFGDIGRDGAVSLSMIPSITLDFPFSRFLYGFALRCFSVNLPLGVCDLFGAAENGQRPLRLDLVVVAF